MITESQPAAPVVRRDGEPCPACGAPLAGDQRYCLHCGARRPEARLEFLDVLDADVRARQAPPHGGPPLVGGAIAPAYAAPPSRGLNGRLQANAGLLALAALLLMMLLIGLLVGHWATDRDSSPAGAAAAPAPQVIRVEGTAAPAAAAADSGTSGAGSGGGKASSSKASKSSSKAKADAASEDAVSVESLSSKKAVEDAVKKGKPISTGTGKLPAKDDKPPAGGTDFEEIG